MGVWIETNIVSFSVYNILSHPVWVCGLKHNNYVIGLVRSVTPRVGVWIETTEGLTPIRDRRSHPVWVCGLKHSVADNLRLDQGHTPCGCVDWNCNWSWFFLCYNCHTPCGCVDWNVSTLLANPQYGVTPRVGVWIETCIIDRVISVEGCHTPCGCVDWNT